MLNKNLKDIKVSTIIYVFLYSLGLSILGGVIFGYIDYFLQTSIRFTFSGILYWLVAIYIGKTVKKVAYEPHLVYTLIAGFFMVFSFSLIDTIPILLYSGYTMSDTAIFFNFSIYLESMWLLINPITGITMGVFQYIITILILIVGTYLGIEQTK